MRSSCGRSTVATATTATATAGVAAAAPFTGCHSRLTFAERPGLVAAGMLAGWSARQRTEVLGRSCWGCFSMLGPFRHKLDYGSLLK